MGIREKLNENPRITTGATAGIIVIALGFIIYQLVGGGGPDIPDEAWYTVDDGETFFADDINKIAPFDHEGKQALRAQVFTCDGGTTKFVAYLERYTPEAKSKLEEARSKGADAAPDPALWETVAMGGMEVKKPKDPNAPWVKQMDYQKAAEIMQPKCPDGSTTNIEPVLP
jgi:hypothetical protein